MEVSVCHSSLNKEIKYFILKIKSVSPFVFEAFSFSNNSQSEEVKTGLGKKHYYVRLSTIGPMYSIDKNT